MLNPNRSARTVLRYARVYGIRRALAKTAGRRREATWLHPFFLPLIPKSRLKHISLIGCGQAAFATIAYFLAHHRGAVMLHAFDTNEHAARSLARYYGLEGAVTDAEVLINDPRCTHIYIASNHASHADYTVRALNAGKVVFTEKPLVTNRENFRLLRECFTNHRSSFFAGYNRPFAPAVRKTVEMLKGSATPFTLLCYVHGHQIPAGHWYRHPEEGTRICGNAGHWIDLFVHIHAAVYGSLPGKYRIDLLSSDEGQPDDNFSLSVTTATGDLFTLVMSSRSEPPMGVREMIELQCGSISAQIDDFRALTLSDGKSIRRIRYSPKDVGHRACVLQPFHTDVLRNPEEVFCSTGIMLTIMEMALGQKRRSLAVGDGGEEALL